MNADEARTLIRDTLREIAPEADLGQVLPGEPLQESLDLDSIDFLNFVTGLNEATGVEIPERDYPQLSTLEGCVDYLVARSPVT
jgi:acyl carrier protein